MMERRLQILALLFGSTAFNSQARGVTSPPSWLLHSSYDEARRDCGGTSPAPIAQPSQWRIPLDVPNRLRWDQVHISGQFMEFRASPRRGHLHTGIDIAPRLASKRDSFTALAAAPGIVCAVFLERPQRTVIVRHQAPSGSSLFTVYKHLASVEVRPGTRVGTDTVLGSTEAGDDTYGPEYAHLHFELRPSLPDGGVRSYTSMTRGAVARSFLNPQSLLDQHP